jgi:poly(3-hydroxybutyrate) depolymerase
MNDVDLAKAAALLLTKEACVDETKVFALGFSAGSMMSNRVACDAGDTFRGVVAISGFLDPLVGLECALNKQRPMNYITYCGTKDDRCMAMVTRTWKMWGKKNNCSQEVKATATTVTTWCAAFAGCAEDVIVERCLILGMDDQVPGHNRTWFFGLQPFQPTTHIDSIDYSFKRFASLPSQGKLQTRSAGVDESLLPVMV